MLAELADRLGLTRALGPLAGMRKRHSAHDPGRVLPALASAHAFPGAARMPSASAQGGEAAPRGSVARPAGRAGVVSLTMEAHGVTARERQVVELMLRGHPNAAIAARLVLSPLTVQDHLKSALRKLGVAGRAELTARLVAHHHLPRIEAGATPDADGALTAGLRS